MDHAAKPSALVLPKNEIPGACRLPRTPGRCGPHRPKASVATQCRQNTPQHGFIGATIDAYTDPTRKLNLDPPSRPRQPCRRVSGRWLRHWRRHDVRLACLHMHRDQTRHCRGQHLLPPRIPQSSAYAVPPRHLRDHARLQRLLDDPQSLIRSPTPMPLPSHPEVDLIRQSARTSARSCARSSCQPPKQMQLLPCQLLFTTTPPVGKVVIRRRLPMGFRPDRVTTYGHDKCLNKATSGRWAAVGDEVRLDEAGCRIALIRKGPHGHTPPHRG